MFNNLNSVPCRNVEAICSFKLNSNVQEYSEIEEKNYLCFIYYSIVLLKCIMQLTKWLPYQLASKPCMFELVKSLVNNVFFMETLHIIYGKDYDRKVEKDP